MRIFSKKAFAIGPGAQQGSTEIDSFITVPGAFQDMPDKFNDDPTFKLAVKAGDITVINGSAQQHEVEKRQADGHEKAPVDDKASQTAAQAFYEELKVMNKDGVAALAEKYGIEVKDGEKLKDLKKRVFEAFKIAEDESDDDESDDDGNSGDEE